MKKLLIAAVLLGSTSVQANDVSIGDVYDVGYAAQVLAGAETQCKDAHVLSEQVRNKLYHEYATTPEAHDAYIQGTKDAATFLSVQNAYKQPGYCAVVHAVAEDFAMNWNML